MDEVSDYERQRLENIKRNRLVMQSLGLEVCNGLEVCGCA